MNARDPIPFKADWPAPDARYLRPPVPEPPALPLDEVLLPRQIRWIRGAAESKAAPPDYVLAGLLSVSGSLIGNTRWVEPWPGWSEPPILWAVAIGNPSLNKSPGLDTVLSPLKRVEREMRECAQQELSAWRERAEVAKLAESAWKETAKAAIKEDMQPPARPAAANPGPEPFLPRLSVADATVEKLAVIASRQIRGTLLARDELSGWLQGMTRYSGGGTDRPFWLEAYGGRSYTVERMGRDPVDVDWLSVGVVGGIQPDRLRSLLVKTDDDGLLARFLPFWPDPVPLKRPVVQQDADVASDAIRQLLSLRMPRGEDGQKRPRLVPFTEETRGLLDGFRVAVRGWEGGAEGLLLSFIGKLPGMAVRLSLVLAFLDWAFGEADEPLEIAVEHFGRATHLIESYLLPMARRSYADASVPKAERVARRLAALIGEQSWNSFTSRDVLRLNRAGISSAAELKPALETLEEADVIRALSPPASPGPGRPVRMFTVNPAFHRMRE